MTKSALHILLGESQQRKDELNPDWLPTQNVGHSKMRSASCKGRYEKKMRIRAEQQYCTEEAACSGMQDCEPERQNDTDTKTTSVGTQTLLSREQILLFQDVLDKAQNDQWTGMPHEVQLTTFAAEFSLHSDPICPVLQWPTQRRSA